MIIRTFEVFFPDMGFNGPDAFHSCNPASGISALIDHFLEEMKNKKADIVSYIVSLRLLLLLLLLQQQLSLLLRRRKAFQLRRRISTTLSTNTHTTATSAEYSHAERFRSAAAAADVADIYGSRSNTLHFFLFFKKILFFTDKIVFFWLHLSCAILESLGSTIYPRIHTAAVRDRFIGWSK
jgi:uncharacterized MAPEG superfamily protein